MQKKIEQIASVRGVINVPGDKSISHRGALFAALARGTSSLNGFSSGADCMRTLTCLQSLGVDIRNEDGRLSIDGLGREGFTEPAGVLNAGNSGTTLRLLTGILAGQRFDCTITGDEYLIRRPMRRIIEPLRKMGALIDGTAEDTAPLRIRGAELTGIEYELPVASAQVKSCVLLAGLIAKGSTSVIEPTPCRDHTERMLALPAEVGPRGRVIRASRKHEIPPIMNMTIPGDISSAAYWVVLASLLEDAHLEIRGVGLNPTRCGMLSVLREMGAEIEVHPRGDESGEPVGDLIVSSARLRGMTLSGPIIPNVIDEIPVLAVAGAAAEGEFRVADAQELRHKEVDRIRAVVDNLRRMNVEVEEQEDGFIIRRRADLHGALVDAFGDHRIAMAFGVAGCIARGDTIVENAECVDVSYPGFWETLKELAT